jgi:6-phosphogluconolactonase
VTEHGNTLIALERRTDGSLRELQTVSILPAGFSGNSQAAHIAMNAAGTLVYVSNRGHNSIGVYAIATDGRLTHLQTISCGGDWPRFFLLLDNHLIVANQNSGDLVVFDVTDDGTLTPTGKTLSLPKVVALSAL